LRDCNSTESLQKKSKIALFGHFGSDNFGNEGTLKAVLSNLRRLLPEVEFECICTEPASAAGIHGIAAAPISPRVLAAWKPKKGLARRLRTIVLGFPIELYRWYHAFSTLKGTDTLIVPGTGLLTDAFGLWSWGPYNLLKWSVLAKLRGCKLLFVSVGVGPLRGAFSRRFVKSALGLADYRSYRDVSSAQYVKAIGFSRNDDRVFPDLAFSLPDPILSRDRPMFKRRPVVGLGLMNFSSMYGDNKPGIETYQSYINSMLTLAEWLLNRGYGIRLLIGELGDPASDFCNTLRERVSADAYDRIIETAVTSVDELLSQVADTDFVVATRFHNVLFALLNNKPVVSISFHYKCASLMSAMGLSEYCIWINRLQADDLIGKMLAMEENSDNLKSLIAARNDEFRAALEEQYGIIATRRL
jgi:polysaccharide pyruvyl transferase WcaK-like protein